MKLTTNDSAARKNKQYVTSIKNSSTTDYSRLVEEQSWFKRTIIFEFELEFFCFFNLREYACDFLQMCE